MMPAAVLREGQLSLYTSPVECQKETVEFGFLREDNLFCTCGLHQAGTLSLRSDALMHLVGGDK